MAEPRIDARQSHLVGHTATFFSADGRTVCGFGASSHGQLGEEPSVPRPVPIPLGGVRIRAVAAGSYHVGFLTDGGAVLTMGCNQFGQLGVGDTVHRSRPTPTPLTQGVRALSCGGGGSAALLDDGTVHGCGELMGGGSTFAPVAMPQDSAMAQISLGVCVAASIDVDGHVYSWGVGSNAEGKGLHGHGDDVPRHAPERLKGLPSGKQVSCGRIHSVLLCRDGSIWTWGAGANGALGHSDTADQPRPKKVVMALGDARVEHVSAGWQHTLATTDMGEVWGWGHTGAAQLGTLAKPPVVPVPVELDLSQLQVDAKVVAAFAGATHSALVYTTDRTDDLAMATCGLSCEHQTGPKADGLPADTDADQYNNTLRVQFAPVAMGTGDEAAVAPASAWAPVPEPAARRQVNPFAEMDAERQLQAERDERETLRLDYSDLPVDNTTPRMSLEELPERIREKGDEVRTLLVCNHYGVMSAKPLVAALRDSSILSLVFVSCTFGPGEHGVDALCELLASRDCMLTELSLELSPFVRGPDGDFEDDTDGAMVALAGALRGNQSLTSLAISVNDQGAAALANALGANDTLQSLCLADSTFGEPGFRALAGLLERNSTLATLDVGGVAGMSDACFAHLARALAKNTGLIELNAAVTELGHEGAGPASIRTAVEALEMNSESRLGDLNVSWDDGMPEIDDDLQQRLTTLLKRNAHLLEDPARAELPVWDKRIG